MTEDEKKAKAKAYHKQYYEKLKADPERYAKYLDYMRNYRKTHLKNNKKYIYQSRLNSIKYYENNHDKHLAIMNEYNANHREERLEYWHKYSSDPNNIEKIKARRKAYRESHREEIKAYLKEYHKRRKEQNT